MDLILKYSSLINNQTHTKEEGVLLSDKFSLEIAKSLSVTNSNLYSTVRDYKGHDVFKFIDDCPRVLEMFNTHIEVTDGPTEVSLKGFKLHMNEKQKVTPLNLFIDIFYTIKNKLEVAKGIPSVLLYYAKTYDTPLSGKILSDIINDMPSKLITMLSNTPINVIQVLSKLTESNFPVFTPIKYIHEIGSGVAEVYLPLLKRAVRVPLVTVCSFSVKELSSIDNLDILDKRIPQDLRSQIQINNYDFTAYGIWK